ncbi:MAG: Signal transduction histidine-protein kinase BarA [Desulfovibrio sp.]
MALQPIQNCLFNIRETIANATEFALAMTKQKGIGFILSIDDDVPVYARGDALLFSQVLRSLVGNAVKFTERGMVGVTVEAASPLPGKVRLQCAVKDSGVGISRDQIKTLFSPAADTGSAMTRQSDAINIGLANAKMLVDLMGGEIAVSSKPGEGSTFAFSVILEKAEPPSPATSPKQEKP